MAAMMWQDSGSGYLANPTLSDEFRTSLQPLCRFRQFADVEAAIGKNRGETYQWNVYGDTVAQGSELVESNAMPETSFPISQGSVTMAEFGISVPYSGKLEAMSEHDIRKIIFKTLRNDANRAHDIAAHGQFDNALLRYVATGEEAYTLNDDGTTAATNDNPLSTTHIKQIADLMQERNIPTFDGEHYMNISRPTTIRPMKDELEEKHMYTGEGWNRVMNGENGRYEGVRFVTQTNVASEGWTGTKSDASYFFGADTVTEAVACPEELRAKIGEDYGRSKGIAWYYIGNYGIVHADPTSAQTKAQARIIKWDSAA